MSLQTKIPKYMKNSNVKKEEQQNQRKITNFLEKPRRLGNKYA